MGQSAAAEPVNINISLYNSTLISPRDTPKDMLSKGNNTFKDGNPNILEK